MNRIIAFLIPFLLFCTLSHAESVSSENNSLFYQDDSLSILWPEDVPRESCPPQLDDKYAACAMLGQDSGLVMLTRNDNTDVYSTDKLSMHLADSENALKTVKDVHFMQSRIIKPHVGMIDLLRKDTVFSHIPALSKPPIRQTSLIIPTCQNTLYQAFVFLPLESKLNDSDLEKLMDVLSSVQIPGCRDWVDTQSEDSRASSDGKESPEGVFALMPRALIWGIVCSALFILLLIWRKRLSDREKERENRMQDEIVEQIQKDDTSNS